MFEKNPVHVVKKIVWALSYSRDSRVGTFLERINMWALSYGRDNFVGTFRE
jgi:hypothetical protein